MTKQALLEKIEDRVKVTKGPQPMAILSLSDWEKIEDIIEDYLAGKSKTLKRTIREARQELRAGRVFEYNPVTGKFNQPSGSK